MMPFTSTLATMEPNIALVLDALAKATLLLVAIALTTLALRRRSAALRHLLWTLGMFGLVVVPLLTAFAPFRWRVLPAIAPAEATQVAERQPRDRIAAPISTLTAPSVGSVEPGGRRPDGVSAGSAAVTETVAGAASRSPSPSLATTLALIWIAGVAALLARFARGVIKVGRIARHAAPIGGGGWQRLIERSARALAIDVPVDVRRSTDTVMPFACGLRKATIVLPSSADTWNEQRREAVLLHEFAHISRGDLAMNALSHVVRALYWFHPLVWLAAHRVRVEGERACDDVVLRAGARPSDYAEHLLSIVRTVGTTVPSAALAMARRSDFEGRLLAILEPGISRFGLTRGRAGIVAALFLMALTPLAAMAPAHETASATLAADVESLRDAESSGQPLARDPLSFAAGASLPQDPSPAPPVATVQETRSQAAATPMAALVEALGDASPAVRVAAASSLGQLGDPRAIAALAKALREDTDARVREAAARALGEIDDARAVPHLLAALKAERAANVRERIVEALREIDDPSAIPGVIAVLKDPSVGVRRAAVQALSEFDDPSAVPALLDMVKDEDVEVRKYTAEALGEMEDPAGIDALAQLARDPDKDVRVHAISALGDLEDRRVLPVLVAALKDRHAEVRAHAADAIGDLDGLRTAPPALIEALSDADAEVRQNAAESLGEIGDEAAVPALRRLTSDTNSEVRRSAAEALSDIGGPDAIQALMTMLRDPDPEIRRIVAEALGSKRR